MIEPSENWALFENAIKQLTPKTWAQSELIYLRDAYLETERIWLEEVKKITAPRIVLLGEAPLYGKEKNYIYNPKTPPSSFLRASDFEDIYIHTEKRDKVTLIKLMRESGIVVVDAFPFVFNTTDNLTLNFSYMKRPSKRYRVLLHKVFEIPL